jgi:ribonuclease D
MPEDELPVRAPRTDGPPTPRAWAERDPVAAARLTLARERISALSEELGLPAENLVSPDTVRRVLWTPPAPEAADVAAQLTSYGARAWQVELVTPLLVDAIAHAEAALQPDGTGDGTGERTDGETGDEPAAEGQPED